MKGLIRSVHDPDSDRELLLATARETNSAVTSGLLHAPAAISWDINFGRNHISADEPSLRGRQASHRRPSSPAVFIADSGDQRSFRQPKSPPFNFGSSKFVRNSGLSPPTASRGDNAIDAPIGRPWGRDISKPLVSQVPVQSSVIAPASFQRSSSPGRQDKHPGSLKPYQ